MRILHTSDIHLDDLRDTNVHAQGSSSWQALRSTVDIGIQFGADLVIVAGDLFESNRIDATTAVLTAQTLGRLRVPVVVLPGNHDCLVADSVYRRVNLPDVADNIRVFGAPEGATFSFPELDLTVWGKPTTSYGSGTRPLSGIPARGKERWRLGAAHGFYVGGQSHHPWSFQITEEDIASSDLDYVALGHWETFYCVHDAAVKAYYSGSPSFGTQTVAIVDIDKTGVQVHPHRLAP